MQIRTTFLAAFAIVSAARRSLAERMRDGPASPRSRKDVRPVTRRPEATFTASHRYVATSGGRQAVIELAPGRTIGIVEVVATLRKKPDEHDETAETLHR